MSDTITVLILLLIVAVLAKYMKRMAYSEHLTVRPNGRQKELMVNQVLKEKHLFENGRAEIPDIRHIMPWMDAIVYEDLRILSRENKFNKKNVSRVLS